MDLRLRQMALVVKDIEAVRADLEAVFGLAVGYTEAHMPTGPIGMQNRILPVGTEFIELVSPVREGVTGARYLERRGGDGGYMVICQTTDRARRDARIRDLGIRTVGGQDGAAFSFIQYHPKDTGGSFLEVDVHDGADDPIPPWTHAAGSDWMSAIRTEVVNAIVGAEIQAGEPQKTAERWAEVLDLPLERDAAGNPEIRARNGGIRFVPIADGRGEGLGGIDLRAVDAPRALRAADARGIRVLDGAIMIGGVRFRLV